MPKAASLELTCREQALKWHITISCICEGSKASISDINLIVSDKNKFVCLEKMLSLHFKMFWFISEWKKML